MTRLRGWLITAFMFLPLCFFNLAGGASSFRDSQEKLFQYSAIAIASTFIGNFWLGAFLLLNIFEFIYSGGVVGYGQVLNVLFGCLLFLFSRSFFDVSAFKEYKKYILYIIIANTFLMILQRFGMDPIFLPQTNGGVLVPGPIKDDIGFFGVKMANGIFYTLALPVLASVNIFLAPLLIIPIYLCKSSGVMLSVLAASLFYTFHLHKKFFIGLLVALPICFVIYSSIDLKTDPKTFKSRFPVWNSAIQGTLNNSNGLNGIIGYGPDSYRNNNRIKNFLFVSDNFYNHGILRDLPNGEKEFKYFVPNRDSEEMSRLMENFKNTNLSKGQFDMWDNPHNEYINLFFQYGLIGLLLLCGLIKDMITRFKYTIKSNELIVVTSCLLVYFTASLVHFPIEIARIGYLFPVLLGTFYRMTDT